MDLQTYHCSISSIKHGKVLPDARYLFRPALEDVPLEVWKIIGRAETAAKPDPSWNLLKLHMREVAMTFLTYPQFDEDPHPALAEATKINLITGSVVQTDFRQRSNPPILHRKETFLPRTDARRAVYEALTKQEEAVGLYRDPSRIGLRVQWLALLKRLNFDHEGHTLIHRPVWQDKPESENNDSRPVDRHRTAIKRYDLSSDSGWNSES